MSDLVCFRETSPVTHDNNDDEEWTPGEDDDYVPASKLNVLFW